MVPDRPVSLPNPPRRRTASCSAAAVPRSMLAVMAAIATLMLSQVDGQGEPPDAPGEGFHLSQLSSELRGEQGRGGDENDCSGAEQAAQCRVLAVQVCAAPFGGVAVRDELVFGPLRRDAAAALETESIHPHFDGAPGTGQTSGSLDWACCLPSRYRWALTSPEDWSTAQTACRPSPCVGRR